jgi:uroporphyrin-III C-methyltransferase
MTRENIGKVYLVGVGPGDPELITIKAVKCIQKADVILTDRLVSPTIFEEYVQPHTEVIEVGKQCKQTHSTPQETINALILDLASQGKTVVRLKGGDVTIFSNVLDELHTCVDNGIPFELIPGVTSATGAAAYAGIPLTARGYSVAARILTLYKPDLLNENYWRELAATKDTLIFYMSAETVGMVVGNLTKYGIDPACGVAVVEQATTPMQKVHTWSIYDFDSSASYAFASPSLIIIGKVVTLHNKFKWNENSESDELYFKPVNMINSII